jgi:predicted N-acyltransferase
MFMLVAMIEVSTIPSLAVIAPDAWDALVGPEGCPFLEHSFLFGLETAGCVGPGTGWQTRHVVVREDDKLVAAMPLYRKDDSYGEFIFDWGWADAAHRAGLPYYPKMVAAAPFSPVAGPRMLSGAAPVERYGVALIEGARKAAEAEPATGIHLLFVSEAEEGLLEAQGMAVRHTHQFHWSNGGYESFEAFLGRFKSKRRAQIRRERREVRAAGVTVRFVQGDALGEEHLDLAWRLYCSTVDKYMQGNRYLNHAFFEHLLSDLSHRVVLALAEKEGRVIAGTVNLQKGDVFYGRYWGCFEEVPFLHFELCCYAPIERAIQLGLQRVEAGAGGGHKFMRGFLPVTTRSAHEIYLAGLDGAVRRFVAHEREGLARELSAVEGRVLRTAAATEGGEEPPSG